MEKLLTELVERLKKAHGESVVSVVLYGSAATPESNDQRSDINILCVVREVTPKELEASETVFRWWRELKNPAPLLMSAEEIKTCTDCFPMEFHDLKERHRILAGANVVEPLEINDVFYRGHVEHELRAKLFRLRQKASGVLQENDLLLRLMLDSVSTFCVLFRHALRLSGDAPRFGKREIIESAREYFGIDPAPFLKLIDLRENKIKENEIQPKAVFANYLAQIQVVVNAVDRIQK